MTSVDLMTGIELDEWLRMEGFWPETHWTDQDRAFVRRYPERRRTAERGDGARRWCITYCPYAGRWLVLDMVEVEDTREDLREGISGGGRAR